MHFPFENHVLSKVLKDFSVENLETTLPTFLSKFSSKICLSAIINYWGSIFTLNWTWGAFSLVCVVSVFFFSFFLLSFFFCRYFPWRTWRVYTEGRGNHYFSFFPLPPVNEHSLSSLRFIKLLFTQSVCNYETDSWWDLFSLKICILFTFLLVLLSRSYWLWYFKVTLWEFELISNYLPSITKWTL